MAIQKLNNKTTHGAGEVITKDGFLKVVQRGQVQTPFRAQQLDATNVCYLAKTRVAHNFPIDTDISGTSDGFVNVPIIHANKLTGYFVRDALTGKLKECWAPFNEKVTEFYSGTVWCERVDYSFVTTTHIYFCTLYIRRAGTFNAGGKYLGGDLIDYYAILPSNLNDTALPRGGGDNNVDRYLIWDFYDYDSENNLVDADNGTLPLCTRSNEQNIETWKYSNALHSVTGG